MSSKLFVNSAWTSAAKVPKTTPSGVALVFGVNAFASLDAAKAYADAHAMVPPVIYHDGDKNILLDNTALGITDIRSQEIEPVLSENPAKGSYSAKSKVSPVGSITVTDSYISLNIDGFKEVSISGSPTWFTVRGGSNQVVHSYSVTETKSTIALKNSATVTGKAEGKLTVSGAVTLNSAEGAWAEAAGSCNDDINDTEPAFEPAMAGDPADPSAWGGSIAPSLLTEGMPGYAAVTLSSGAFAGRITGGSLNYARTTEATRQISDSTLLAVNKSLSLTAAAAGTLDITDASVFNALYYANVTLRGSSTDFSSLHGGSSSTTDKTTWKYTPANKGIKMTSDYTENNGATGALSIGDIGPKISHGRNVGGYAKVTVDFGSATLGSLYAQNTKFTIKESCDIVSSGASTEQYTSSYSETGSGAAGGTLSAGATASSLHFDTITGFGTVTLADADIKELSAGTYTSSYSDNQTSSGGNLVQEKKTDKYSSAAAGTVTLSYGSVVQDGIGGYQTVKLSDTAVSGHLRTGKRSWDNTSAYTRTEKSGIVTETDNSQRKDSSTAFGTLTMTGGSIKNKALVGGFATVTLDGVTGEIDSMTALNFTGEERMSKTSVGGVQTLDENSFVSSLAGTGTLTAISGGGLTISSIHGYNKIALTGTELSGGITHGGTLKFSSSYKMTYDTKADLQKSAIASHSSATAAGSVVLSGAIVGDGIAGYQTVTLDDTVVSGDIDASSFVSSFSSSEENIDGGGTTLRSGGGFSSSWTPTGVLTLRNGAIVYGSTAGIKTLTLDSGTGIGDVIMEGGTSRSESSYAHDTKKGTDTWGMGSSYTGSAVGTVTATDIIAGTIYGAAKVTATSAIVGGLFCATSSGQGMYSETISGIFSSTVDSSVYMQSAAATAILTSADVGDIDGFSNVKLVAGTVCSAVAANTKGSDYEAVSPELYSSAYSSGNSAIGTFTAIDGALINGDISGYKTVSLENVTMYGNIDTDHTGYSDNLKVSYSPGGISRIGQSYVYENVSSAMTTATLKGAYVSGEAYGVKTLNLSAATLEDGVYMGSYNAKETNSITRNGKTSLFEQSSQYVASYNAGGVLTATEGSYIGGYVNGANKVTLTSSFLNGGIFGSSSFDSYSLSAKGANLTAESAGYPVDVDSDFATEWTEKYTSSASAAGTFTMTDGTVGGAISGFATVKLTGAIVAGAYAGMEKITSSHLYKKGADVFSAAYTSGTCGTLTATGVSFNDGSRVIEGFATVTLTDCACDGDISGGFTEDTWIGSGTGANFAVVGTAAETAAVNATTWKNAGTLTAVRTSQTSGDIFNMATVNLTDCATGDIIGYPDEKMTLNFSGNNAVCNISGCTALNVKNGSTDAINFRGTDGADTFTVNAGTTLNVYDLDFGDGSDKAVINGTVHLLGTLNNIGKLAISGAGTIAATAANYAAVKSDLELGLLGDVSWNGKVSLVNAGTNESTVRAIRTVKEELADNKSAGAQKFSGEMLVGWLSGEEDDAQGKFADTEDWIRYGNVSGLEHYVSLDDDLRHDDVTVEVWKGKTKIEDVGWDAYKNCFVIDNSAFADGAEYLLRLNIADGKEALAYTFSRV